MICNYFFLIINLNSTGKSGKYCWAVSRLSWNIQCDAAAHIHEGAPSLDLKLLPCALTLPPEPIQVWQSLWWGDYPVKCLSEAWRWSQREAPAGLAWACPLPTGPCSFALHSEGSHTEPEANLPSRTPPQQNDFSGFVAARPKAIMSWNQCQ